MGDGVLTLVSCELAPCSFPVTSAMLESAATLPLEPVPGRAAV